MRCRASNAKSPKAPNRVQTSPPPPPATSTNVAALARELEHTKTRLAETRESLAGKEAETTRLRAALDEERAKVSRLEATLAETEDLKALAEANGTVLFAAWHSRFAPGISHAQDWLASRTVTGVTIDWHEDVRDTQHAAEQVRANEIDDAQRAAQN